MKKLLVFSFSFASFAMQAQDLIYFANGSQQNAKVLEVGTPNIIYKKSENPDGPTYLATRNEIDMIIYANGTRDILEGHTAVQQVQQPSAQNPQYSSPVQTYSRPRVNIIVAPPVTYYNYGPVCRPWVGGRYQQPYHHSYHHGHRF